MKDKFSKIDIEQRPPSGDQKVVDESDFWAEINDIFQSYTGYKVKSWSYGRYILGIAAIGWVLAFLLFFELWFITDSNIDRMIANATSSTAGTSNPTSISNSGMPVPFNSLTEREFWFGVILITFPTILYAFAFATYLSVLYDSRLTEIVKLFTVDTPVKRKFLKYNRKKFELERARAPRITKVGDSLGNLIGARVYTDLEVPGANLSATDYYRNKEKLFRFKSIMVTDLIQKLSMKIDGSTLAGYFFPVILLQIIVAASLVLPAIEFSRLGAIGVDTFAETCQNMPTCHYLSIWPIAWAVLGAFVYSFISLMDRIPRKDVTPRYFLNVALRYIFAIALCSVFFLVSHETLTSGMTIEAKTFSLGWIAAVSFFIGMFPNRYFRVIASLVDNKIFRNFSNDIPLEKFTGIHSNEATRLWEEGIDNVDQLADSSVQDLYKRTRFDPNRLKGLVGRALQWKYVFGLENMIFLLDIRKIPEKEQEYYNSVIQEIRLFPFSDIQSLCAYIFSQTLDDLEEVDLNKIDEIVTQKFNLTQEDKSAKERYLGKEVMLRVAYMSSYFKKQLQFKETTQEIKELIQEEVEVEGGFEQY
jgi:hypothetical protein